MTATAAPQFTAAKLAAHLGKTPQAVRRMLRDLPASGVVIVSGNQTAAWSFKDLPERVQQALQTEATRRGYRNTQAMLAASPSEPWQPSIKGKPVRLIEIQQACIDAAVKLQRALAPSIVRLHDLDMRREEFDRLGVEDYRREHGHAHRISTRYFRELLKRTLDRDAGAEDYGRLELYLAERLARKQEPAAVVNEALTDCFPELTAYIGACADPANPSRAEREEVWRLAFEVRDRTIAEGTRPNAAARRVRKFLAARCPFLAPTRDALRKAFDRKRDPAARKDRRTDNGPDGYQWPQADLDAIEHRIMAVSGEYDPAWKYVCRKRLISAETLAHYRNHRKAPDRLKELLHYDRPRWMYLLNRRRRDFDQAKAKFTTLDDGLRTLDVISADDVTLPVWMWYQPDPNLPPIITRGQCLVFIDVRSRRILGWSLQPEKTYNALVIYTETARVLTEKGLPKVMIWEKGIWERSKILGGRTPFSVAEVIKGFRDVGEIEFIHTHTPSGKSEIENVMGRIQDLMEDQPGYAGRAEIYDRPDWIKRQLAELQSANGPHPSKHLYSFGQWDAKLAEIFTEYNALPQDGEKMRGQSPDEIYYAHWPTDDPPARLGPELRHFLAHARYEKEVKPSGIQITNGRRTFKYFGPELAHLVGDTVVCWFDPGLPDVLVVTDMKHRNPIAVPLHNGVDRVERLTNPGSGQLSNACARRDGQVSQIVARYNVLKDQFEMPYRRNLKAVQAENLGTKMDEQKAAVRQRRVRVSNLQSKARKLSVPAALVNDDDQTRNGLDMMERARREHEREQALKQKGGQS